MHCPACSTEQVRKFSIVYEEGTSRGSSEGSSDHPRDKASYTAEHFSQTALAARCSPPHEPDVGFVLGSIGIVLSVCAGIRLGKATASLWWGMGCFFVVLWTLYLVWRLLLAKRAFARYEAAYRCWEQSWVCMSCGVSFKTRAPDNSSADARLS